MKHPQRSRTAIGLLLLLQACATPAAPRPGAGTPGPRSEPDDQDLWGLVPADARTLVWADMAQLRESPWTRKALTKAAPEERASLRATRGFDEVADVDRLVFASLSHMGAGGSLLVAQGRFDRDALAEAFHRQGPHESSNYRSIGTLGRPGAAPDAGEALGFLTRRTVLSGARVAVRAAIDCGFDVAVCLDASDWLTAIHVALAATRGPSRQGPALLGAFRLDQTAREQLQSELGEGGALEQVGVRADLGNDLDITAVGFVSTHQRARDMAARLAGLVREQRNRPIVLLLGLREVVSGIRVAARGNKVEASLHVPEAQRDMIAERMTTLAEMLARARAGKAAAERAP
jgi:hypothetical protein